MTTSLCLCQGVLSLLATMCQHRARRSCLTKGRYVWPPLADLSCWHCADSVDSCDMMWPSGLHSSLVIPAALTCPDPVDHLVTAWRAGATRQAMPRIILSKESGLLAHRSILPSRPWQSRLLRG